MKGKLLHKYIRAFWWYNKVDKGKLEYVEYLNLIVFKRHLGKTQIVKWYLGCYVSVHREIIICRNLKLFTWVKYLVKTKNILNGPWLFCSWIQRYLDVLEPDSQKVGLTQPTENKTLQILGIWNECYQQFWSPYLCKNIHALDKVQHKFTRFIPGIRRLSLRSCNGFTFIKRRKDDPIERLKDLYWERLECGELECTFVWYGNRQLELKSREISPKRQLQILGIIFS